MNGLAADFEPCTDDGPGDEFAFSARGHHEPSRTLLLVLGRAISYECGCEAAETVEYLATVRWHKGFSGNHPTKYDYLACDEDGVCLTDCDDDGNEITLTDVTPTTWAILKADPPRRVSPNEQVGDTRNGPTPGTLP